MSKGTRKKSAPLIIVAVALAHIQFLSIALGDEPRRSNISHAKSHISIDGLLNEPAWSEAALIGDLLQREPHPGEKATEQTEVKILYDSANLYIGIMCYDSEPGRIIATQMARDADLSSDDRIEMLLDSFHDRRNAFYFATNPLGALADGLFFRTSEAAFTFARRIRDSPQRSN
jgi:hypothetical protein